MTVKDAVAKRFEQLCDQRGIRPNELATRAGVTPSTVYSMLDPSRQRVSIATIKNSVMALISRLVSSFPVRCLMSWNRRSNNPSNDLFGVFTMRTLFLK